MDGGAPIYLRLMYVDGVAVPIPDNVAGPSVRHGGGFFLGAQEVKAARQRDHYARVRRRVRQLPDLAASVGGEDTLVNLLYGDVDDFGRLLQGPLAPGVYVNYVQI